jgi:COP9 signalosome complex subunit 2
MTSLVAAYQDRDVKQAEKILKANKATITADPFIRYFIDDLLRSLRTEFIVNIIKPYTRMKLDFLAEVQPVHRATTDTFRPST